MPTPAPLYSRPLSLWLCLALPLALIVLLLAFPPTSLDFAISHLFYSQELGFVGKHSYWLEDILHDRAKQAVISFAVLAALGLMLSLVYKPWTRLRLPLAYLVLAMSLCTAIVTPLKVVTGVHCPWDLSEFGGTETYSPLLGTREPTAKPGRCWPAGHASSGFTFFALYFLLRDRRPRLAKVALVFALALGSLLSIGRIMQGAHFLSHSLWTALFDWMIALGCYHFLLYRPQPKSLALEVKAVGSLD
ncbi:MAG: phosphatase PAP2 family protein [Pseudomonas sp.]|uniref:phosphatase PAP2 family protein n=1 Tax=Pseudomonas sp. TaxID=306 RepID=UPI003BB5667E